MSEVYFILRWYDKIHECWWLAAICVDNDVMREFGVIILLWAFSGHSGKWSTVGYLRGNIMFEITY